jgi:hypothetical protein
VGSASDEAAKLLASLAGWIGDHIATGDEECRLCPVCVLIRGVREVNPEAVRHLAVAGWSLAAAARAFLEDAAQSDRSAAEERGGADGPGVAAGAPDRYGSPGHPSSPTHIDIAEAGNAGGPAGRDVGGL